MRSTLLSVILVMLFCWTGLSVSRERQGGTVHYGSQSSSRHVRQMPSREEDTSDAHGALR